MKRGSNHHMLFPSLPEWVQPADRRIKPTTAAELQEELKRRDRGEKEPRANTAAQGSRKGQDQDLPTMTTRYGKEFHCSETCFKRLNRCASASKVGRTRSLMNAWMKLPFRDQALFEIRNARRGGRDLFTWIVHTRNDQLTQFSHSREAARTILAFALWSSPRPHFAGRICTHLLTMRRVQTMIKHNTVSVPGTTIIDRHVGRFAVDRVNGLAACYDMLCMTM